jgi:hypothetical protein
MLHCSNAEGEIMASRDQCPVTAGPTTRAPSRINARNRTASHSHVAGGRISPQHSGHAKVSCGRSPCRANGGPRNDPGPVAVPPYFVDFNDGQTEVRDDMGPEAPGPEAARDEAVRLLTEAAKDGVARNREQLLVATPRR